MRRRAASSHRHAEAAVTQLVPRRVEKPWGRRDLGAPFGPVGENEAPLGEIWFERPDGGQPELLIKYLFTSEDLSVQVHPDDATARAAGLAGGKDEAWFIVRTAPDAMIGLGLREVMTKQDLRAAALDGRIVNLLFWHVAKPGDFIYLPAGTIHAIGAGAVLIEIQQNVDLTYRLYDYGRPRELHLDEAISAADPTPYVAATIPYQLEAGRQIMADGAAFVVERWSGGYARLIACKSTEPVWAVPVHGASSLNGMPVQPGSAWMIEGEAVVQTADPGELLIAYSGKAVKRFQPVPDPANVR